LDLALRIEQRVRREGRSEFVAHFADDCARISRKGCVGSEDICGCETANIIDPVKSVLDDYTSPPTRLGILQGESEIRYRVAWNLRSRRNRTIERAFNDTRCGSVSVADAITSAGSIGRNRDNGGVGGIGHFRQCHEVLHNGKRIFGVEIGVLDPKLRGAISDCRIGSRRDLVANVDDDDRTRLGTHETDRRFRSTVLRVRIRHCNLRPKVAKDGSDRARHHRYPASVRGYVSGDDLVGIGLVRDGSRPLADPKDNVTLSA